MRRTFPSPSARWPSGRTPAASCSRSSRRTPAARSSRSAALAATRRCWLASAARILGGRVVTLEQETGKIEAWRRNIADAGLEEWAELVEGDAKETLPELEDGFDVVFLDAWKDDYELLFGLARTKLDPGGIVVADNVTTSSTVEAYAAARQADPTLVSVTVPIGHGLEVTTVLQP